MRVNGKDYRTIWLDGKTVKVIDQRQLPFEFVIEEIKTVDEMAVAIKEMHVRGAGLIGAAAGFGMYLACLNASSESFETEISQAAEKLIATRPTAVNLAWAVKRQLAAISRGQNLEEKIIIVLVEAKKIADEDAAACEKIGEYGLEIIQKIFLQKKGEPMNILTHCNAGWLAFVDWGSALAPIYKAQAAGIPIHVWVDETRPWNQGARLTAWELEQQGVPYHLIADNTGGHLMQHGLVDLVLVGADRVTRTGDAANKIGTYLKALAARDNNIPFYVALPSSTFDLSITDGAKQIPIEERGSEEVKYISGLADGKMVKVLIALPNAQAKNFVFDVTPARLITGLITEQGICGANEKEILKLFPESNI